MNLSIVAHHDLRSATSVAFSSSIAGPISLFEPITTEEGANVVKYLNKINSVTKEDKNYSHPAIIGSRAAAFWMDFYRTRDYRDTVATRIQAMKLIEENHASSKLNIKLIVHSLDTSDTRRKPLPEDAKQRIATPPRLLFKLEIEIAVNDQEFTVISTARQILKLCHANKSDVYYTNVFLGSGEGTACTRIYWPAHFVKHIADLDILRAALALLEPPSSTANISIFADKGKPLTPPTRSPQIEDLLFARTLEMEAFRGELKMKQAKTMVFKNLFEKTKKEAVVIALERFLLPNSLIRICSTLTEGCFRQFAADNVARLSVCGKGLLPIRDTVITKHPLPLVGKKDSLDLMGKKTTNLDNLEHYFNESDCIANFSHHATLGVQPLNTIINVDCITQHMTVQFACSSQLNFHKMAVAVCANNGGGYWIIAQSLENKVDMLDVEGLTGYLLMAYIVTVVQLELPSSGDTPLRNTINKLKVQVAIPVSPANHP
ncbi:hypothetical protein V8B55DRAFT_1558884 [Mucor lusitanicus]